MSDTLTSWEHREKATDLAGQAEVVLTTYSSPSERAIAEATALVTLADFHRKMWAALPH